MVPVDLMFSWESCSPFITLKDRHVILHNQIRYVFNSLWFNILVSYNLLTFVTCTEVTDVVKK